MALAFSATTTAASTTSLQNAKGEKVRISCSGFSCYVTQRGKAGSWINLEKTAGGPKNFEALAAKYKSLGFN